MKSLSNTTRITLWYTVFLIAVSVILIVVLYQYNVFREQSIAEKEIIQTIEDVSDKISTNGKDYAKDPSIDYYTKDTYVSVYDSEGAFFAGMFPEDIGQLPELQIDKTQIFDDDHAQQWYIHDTTIYMEGSDNMYIRGIMKNTGYERVVGKVAGFYLLVILGLIILAIAGGRRITKGALRPVRNLISVMNDIQEDGDLSSRVPVPGSNDETRELTESINGMFDTIETVVGRERQFTSDVSHELRTPLTIIRTQSEYAMEDKGYMDQALKTINRESHRMSRMITDLMMLSRSESGRLHPEMKPVDIREFLSEMAEEAKIAASDRDIGIDFIDETDGSKLEVESDEDLLMRIVLNLLENAARHGKSLGGQIEIRLSSDEDSAVITVADDGEGIAAEEQSKVWTRFYQTEESRSKRDSSGLGLAMVESLTKTLGGSIRIVPDEEKRQGELPGAVFELILPTGKH